MGARIFLILLAAHSAPLAPQVPLPPAAAGVTPAAAKPLSLQECLQMALAHSPEIHLAQERVAEAQALRQKSRAPFLPSLTAGANQIVLGHDEEGKINDGNRWNKDTYNATLEGALNLFNNGKDKARYDSAAAALAAAQYAEAAARHDLLLETARAYYGLLRQRRLVAVNEQNVKARQEHLDLFEKLYASGVRPYSNVLNAKVQLRQAQINLESAVAEALAAKAALNILLDLPVLQEIEIIDIDTLSLLVLNFEESLKTAYQRRPDLLESEKVIERLAKEMSLAEREFWPGVSVTGAYKRQLDLARTELTPSFAVATFNPLWRINLGLSWPFFNGGRDYYERQRARALHHQAQAEKDKIKRQVKAQTVQAYLSVAKNEKIYHMAQEQVEAAGEDLRLTLEQYRLGSASALEAVDAQTRLVALQTEEAKALYEFYIAQFEHDRAVGTLDKYLRED